MRDRRRSGQLTRVLTIALGFVLMLVTSCSTRTRIPQTEWQDLEWRTGSQWTVRTHHFTYRVQYFAVTDSTIILKEVSDIWYYERDADSSGHSTELSEVELPIVVPLKDVQTIERTAISEGRTFVAIVGISAFIIVVVALVAEAYALSHMFR